MTDNSLTRREMLKATAAIGVAALAGTAVAAQEERAEAGGADDWDTDGIAAAGDGGFGSVV